MRRNGVANAIAVGLLVIGILVGVTGYYVATTYQTKTVTQTATQTETVPTTLVSSTIVTYTFTQVTTLTVASNGPQLLATESNVRMFIQVYNLNSTNTDFQVTFENDNPFNVTLSYFATCGVNQDGGETGCISSGSMTIPSESSYNPNPYDSIGSPVTVAGASVTATLETPQGEFSVGPILVYQGAKPTSDVAITNLSCSVSTRTCFFDVSNTGNSGQVFSGCKIYGISGTLGTSNMVLAHEAVLVSCADTSGSSFVVGTSVVGSLSFYNNWVLFFQGTWSS